MSVPFIPILNCIGVRISARWDDYPNVMNNVINVAVSDAHPSSAQCADVAAAVEDWCGTNYAGWIADNWTIFKVEAFARDSQTGGFGVVATNVAGGSGAGTQPDAAPLFLLKTGTRGRSFSGRFYALAPEDASIGIQSYTSTPILGILTALGNLELALAGVSAQLGVASPTLQEINLVEAFTNSTRLTKIESRRLSFGG